MIVDDSLVARTVMGRMLEGRPDFVIVAFASSADHALALLDQTEVDIILLDLEMPGTDGLTALPDLLVRGKGARVLIVSSAAAEGAAATVRALALGAADTLLKPGAGRFDRRFANALVERLRRIGRAYRRADAADASAHAPAPSRTAAAVPGAIECLAIGASTGGLNALSDFFRVLPPSFTAPILITQHLPDVFMSYFAAQLQDVGRRVATVATSGARLKPGEMLIAPGHAHLGLARTRDGVVVDLDRTPAASGSMPSVDPMFSAVAEVYGAAAVGVVLSGMGRDGVLGAADLARAGGELLVQDPESSVVWGMPGAVANSGLATAVLPPDRIACRVAARVGDAAWK